MAKRRQSNRPELLIFNCSDFYQQHLQILHYYNDGLARHREMGHKRLGGDEWDPWVGREGAADNGGVYDSSRSLFRCMGLLSRSSPHPRDFLSGYLGHWDGIRRSSGPTYRYPSTRRSWSRALLRSLESFWSCFFVACGHGTPTKPCVILQSDRFCRILFEKRGIRAPLYKMCYWGRR
jgi:hypothetical protein